MPARGGFLASAPLCGVSWFRSLLGDPHVVHGPCWHAWRCCEVTLELLPAATSGVAGFWKCLLLKCKVSLHQSNITIAKASRELPLE